MTFKIVNLVNVVSMKQNQDGDGVPGKWMFFNADADTVTAEGFIPSYVGVRVGDQVEVINAARNTSNLYEVVAGSTDTSKLLLELYVAPVNTIATKAADVLAVPITADICNIVSGADAEACTLADGVAGQELTLVMITDGGGTATVTPTNFGSGSTLAFDAVGESAKLVFTNDAWYSVGTATATIA